MLPIPNPRVSAIAVAASVLSACTASDYYYSSGPWGPREVRRSPPSYSLPWNPALRRIEDVPVHIDAGGFDPTIVDVTPPPNRVIVALPADPMPPGPAPLPADLDSPEQSLRIDEAPTQPRMLATAPTGAASVVPPPRAASAYAGTWRAVDGAGRSCSVQLSTRTSVDLYRATTSGCAAAGLGAVNLWAYQEGSVTLYAHDKIVAKLSGKEAEMSGLLASGQGSLKMSR